MVFLMEKEFMNTKLVTYIKVNSILERCMVKELISGKMEKFMKALGKKV